MKYEIPAAFLVAQCLKCNHEHAPIRECPTLTLDEVGFAELDPSENGRWSESGWEEIPN